MTALIEPPSQTSAFHLPEPETIEATGIDVGNLLDLILKFVHFGGRPSSRVLTERSRLAFAIVEELLEFLRRQEYVEIVGTAGIGEPDYLYTLTSKGRTKAQEVLAVNQYVGPAPVPFDRYVEVVNRQTVTTARFEREDLHRGLSHLVLSDALKDQIGTAIGSGTSLFLYGAPGNGKTEIARSVGVMLEADRIAVPYAVEAYGQIIRVFDQRVHFEAGDGVQDGTDRRWAITKRPLVMAGGEMTLDDLELNYSEASRFYVAPLQMRANGGVLVIDDFGRQRLRPEELLNRWMIPMDSRIDHITLHTGEMLEVPFDVLLILSTNLSPSKLGDEAFFRRIRHKVHVGNPDETAFLEILHKGAASLGMTCTDDCAGYLLDAYYRDGRPMRGVHPRDILNLIRDRAAFDRHDPVITRDTIDAACSSYFVED